MAQRVSGSDPECGFKSNGIPYRTGMIRNPLRGMHEVTAIHKERIWSLLLYFGRNRVVSSPAAFCFFLIFILGEFSVYGIPHVLGIQHTARDTAECGGSGRGCGHG